jgi:hypothetical protein
MRTKKIEKVRVVGALAGHGDDLLFTSNRGPSDRNRKLGADLIVECQGCK